MDNFDKKIRELSRNVVIPEGFSKKVEDVLEDLPEDEEMPVWKRDIAHRSWKRLGIAVCILCVIVVLAVNSMQAEANIFETFKQTVMDFLHIGTDPETGENDGEDLGVSSNTTEVESKPDLWLEMREVVVDAQGIYLLFKLTAPPEITLTEDITFDYFAFCEGENYNATDLIGGGTSCRLFETMEEKPNVATYMMDISTDMRPYEGKMITAYMQNLTLDPYGEHPQVLVEGMWKLSFQADMTVRDSLTVEGSEDMSFPLLGKEGSVERIEMTPLGITMTLNLSAIPTDVLYVSDATVSLRMKMIDGSEIAVMPSDSEQESIVDSGNIEYGEGEMEGMRTDSYLFNRAVELSKVVGFYVQNVYIPIE